MVRAVKTSDLRPFFSYFGGKAPQYPPPEHDIIIEPFAGSAGYATRYPDREVILVEKSPEIAALWRWLIQVSSDEIMALPLDPAERNGLRREAQILVSFWCARGRVRPSEIVSKWMTSKQWPTSFWGEKSRARVATQVKQIRRWRVIEGDYREAPDVRATWFVDPPYAVLRRNYLASVGDYPALGQWCRSRSGTVIVCEQAGADWLPFAPFRIAKSISRRSYEEVAFIQRDGQGEMFACARAR